MLAETDGHIRTQTKQYESIWTQSLHYTHKIRQVKADWFLFIYLFFYFIKSSFSFGCGISAFFVALIPILIFKELTSINNVCPNILFFLFLKQGTGYFEKHVGILKFQMFGTHVCMKEIFDNPKL